jgi:hypothetical protein
MGKAGSLAATISSRFQAIIAKAILIMDFLLGKNYLLTGV